MDFSKIRNYLFLGLLLIVTLLFLNLLRPFAYVIFWAAVLAAISYPAYKKINNRLEHPDLSAIITLSLILVVIIVPILMMGSLLISQSINTYGEFSRDGRIGAWIQDVANWLRDNPYTTSLHIDDAFWTEKFASAAQNITGWLFDFAKRLTQNSFKFFGMFAIMSYTLFFFIRDGEKMLKRLMHLCPLGDKYEERLYAKFVATAGATIKGNLTVAVIQGTLGGILFALTGVPAPLIWAVIMTMLAIIPGIGTFLVWLPIGIVMLILGNVWQGVIILACGALLISTIDNFLRPILVGKTISLHPLTIFFSTLGGVIVFGPSGFVIGPIIASLVVAFWDIYEEYYKDELENN